MALHLLAGNPGAVTITAPAVGATTLTGTAPPLAPVPIYKGTSTTALGTVFADANGVWSLALGTAAAAGDTYRTFGDAITVQSALGLSTANPSVAASAAAGTSVVGITGLMAGETLARLGPADGRFVVNGAGDTILVGLSALSQGTVRISGTTSLGRLISILVTVSGPALGALTLSPNTATVGVAYSGTISGRAAGSTFALSGAGAAGLAVNSSTGAVTGTPTANGSVDITETPAGGGAPRTSSGVLTVGSGSAAARTLIYFSGQSLVEYLFLRGGPAKTSAQYMAADLRTLAGYSNTNAFGSYNQNKSVHDGSSQAATDWSVRLENAASGGSSIRATQAASGATNATVTNAYGEPGNYWLNAPGVDSSAATGNAADNNSAGSDFTPGPLLRRLVSRIQADVAAGYSLAAFVWSQGTSDLTSDAASLAGFKAGTLRIFADARAAAGNASLPIFFQRLHRHQTAPDADAEAIRQIQRDIVAGGTNIHVAAEEYPHRVALARLLPGATVTSGSNVVTLSDTGDLALNKRVVGPGIPDGAYVSAITVNSSVTLSRIVNGVVVAANATASASNATIVRGDDVHLYPGVPGQEPYDYASGTEYDPQQGSNLMVRQSARRIAQVLGFSGAPTAAQGPYVSAASYVRGASTVRATITHVAGTDLSAVTDTVGWRVTIDGTVRTVTAATKVSATAIDLTLDRGLYPADGGSGVSVQYAWGAMNKAVPGQFITDNASPVPYPMQARNPVVATVSEPAYDAQSQQLFAAMTSAPTANRKAAIDNRMRALKAVGYYTYRDRDYVPAAAGAQAASLNWAAPASNPLTLTGSPTFTADRGWTDPSNGAAMRLTPGTYDPTAGGTLWTLNNAGASEYVISAGTYAGQDISDATGRAFLKGRPGTAGQGRLSTQTLTSSVADGVTAPFSFGMERRDAATQVLYRNGALNVSASVASTSPPTAIYVVPSDRVIGQFGFGAALPDDATVAAVYRANLAYMQAIGAVS